MLINAANTYRGVAKSVLEAVQNGFDAGATRVLVGVNHQERVAFVVDNGSGADEKQYELALQSIGVSLKSNDKIGRWGIGMVSPTTDCDTYTFTSWASSDGRVRRWTFREVDIVGQYDLHIPFEDDLVGLPELPIWASQHGVNEFAARWRTIVRMDELKKDRVSSAFDPREFERQVRARFSRTMRKTSALVRLVYVDRKGVTRVYDINPAEFHGEPLEVVRYESSETGVVEFTLFVAAPDEGGQQYGEVFVLKTDDNTTVTASDVSRQALAFGRLGKNSKAIRDGLAALRSGRFEGEVTCQNIVLDIERGKFVVDDALLALYEKIGRWFEEVGWYHYELGREESRDRRWQASGRESQTWLSKLLSKPRYSELWSYVTEVLKAARGEADLEAIEIKPERSAGASKDDAPASNGTGGRPGNQQAAPQPDRDPADKPTADVSHPPAPRKPRQKQQVGLPLAFAALKSRKLWEFDFDTGVLTINVGHEIWGQLDETDGRHESRNARWTSEMQEFLVMHVLVLLAHHPDRDDFEQHRSYIDDLLPLFADSMIMRDTERRRNKGSIEQLDGEDTPEVPD